MRARLRARVSLRMRRDRPTSRALRSLFPCIPCGGPTFFVAVAWLAFTANATAREIFLLSCGLFEDLPLRQQLPLLQQGPRVQGSPLRTSGWAALWLPTTETRHVSFAPATPVKDEPGFPILERRFSEIGQYISDASNVLIAAPRPRTERPELGKAQDSIILAKRSSGASPRRRRGTGDCTSWTCTCRPGRDLTAEDFDEIGDSEDEFLACTGCAGWPDAPSFEWPDAPSVGLPSAPSWARDSSWWKLDVAADEVVTPIKSRGRLPFG